ncbi:MAG: hypothetical protein J0L82_11725 [Deltaproteobacteria bacterium]|nr:hypothetical protein [Deltaproteobacteria bacterium]
MVAFRALIACIFLVQNVLAEDCPNSFHKLFQRQETVDSSVAIIWFPKTDNIYTTTNIEADDTIWGTQLGFYAKSSVDAFKRLHRQKKTGHYRFAMRVSQPELEKLRLILLDTTTNNATCVGGTCNAFSKAGIQRFPFPVNLSPSLNALYLAVNRLIPGSRVTKIEFVGEQPLKTILSSKEFWSENAQALGVAASGGVGAAIAGFVIVDVLDLNDEVKQLIVPIFFDESS